MRKAFLCAVLVLMCVTSAFGGVNEDLFEAAKSDTPKKIETLIKFGADVNAKNFDGRTALMLAAGTNNPEVVDTLIKAGSDVNAKDGYGRTPLMLAAETNKNPEVVNTLIKAGSDVNAKDYKGLTVLMLAAMNNSPEMVNTLIKAGADVKAKVEGFTVLMLAVCDQKTRIRVANGVWTFSDKVRTDIPEVVKVLIKAGADVNAKDDGGMTALMLVVQYTENLQIVKVLIEAGADIFAKDNEGKTVLDYTRDKEIKRIILEAAEHAPSTNVPSKNVPSKNLRATEELWEAIVNYNITPEMLERLINAGADVNAKAPDGGTALTWAIRFFEPGVVNALIKAVADVNAKANLGETALMLAAWCNEPEVVKALIKAGADVNAKDNNGQTALDYAENDEIKRIILEAAENAPSENVSSINLRATEELWQAVDDSTTTSGTIEKLVKAGADVNDMEEFCVTPLMKAVCNCNLEVVKALIKAGANVNDRDETGWTVLMFAAANNSNPEVTKVLLEAGADVSAKEEMGKIALDLIARNENAEEIKRILLDAMKKKGR